jgi:carboxypeptidase family protein
MLVMFAAAVLGAVLQASSPVSATTGRVSGRVVSTYAASVAGVTVVLTRVDRDSIDRRTTTSDADGRFAYDRVADGRYELSAIKPGYTTRRLNESTLRFDAGVPLTVREGARTVNAQLPLRRSATLSGRVVRPDGAAAPAIEVVLARRRGPELIAIADTRTTTAWDGRYEMHDLPPGQYLLLASGIAATPQHLSETAQAAFEINRTRPLDFIRTLYPGVPATDAGAMIRVLEGVVSDGVDLWLAPARRFSISGRVLSPDGVATDRITIEYGNPVDTRASVWTVSDPGGVFTIDGVAPGTVVLLASAESTRGRLMGIAATDVRVGGVEDLSLRLETPGAVEGRVTFPTELPASARPTKITLAPKLLNVSPLYPIPEAPIEADGRFRLTNALGDYEIVIPDLARGLRITSVARGGYTLAGNRVGVTAGETTAGVNVTVGR